MEACEEESQGVSLEGTGDNIEILHGRRAISSGEPSSDGSVDDERSALSDSDLPDALRIRTIATQAKGPSSDALEVECRAEQSSLHSEIGYETINEFDSSEWNDLVGCEGLVYKVLKRGREPKPRNGQEVTIRVEDKLFGIDSFTEVTFVLGYSMVIEAWELTASAMHEGEVVLVKSDPRFAYGSIGDEARNILPNQHMQYEIELLRLGEGIKFSTMTPEVLSEYVQKLKERGKYYYSRGEVDKALFVYKRCTDIVEVPRGNEELRTLLSTIHTNLAVCYAKEGDWKATLTAAIEALRLKESNPKALFWQANAYMNINMVSDACEALKKARIIDPTNKVIAKEFQRARSLQRKCEKQERNLYKRMLAGMHIDEPSRRFPIPYRYLFSALVVLLLGVLFYLFSSTIISFFSLFAQ